MTQTETKLANFYWVKSQKPGAHPIEARILRSFETAKEADEVLKESILENCNDFQMVTTYHNGASFICELYERAIENDEPIEAFNAALARYNLGEETSEKFTHEKDWVFENKVKDCLERVVTLSTGNDDDSVLPEVELTGATLASFFDVNHGVWATTDMCDDWQALAREYEENE